MRLRMIGLWMVRIAAIAACLFSYFVTFGVTCCVPGGEFPERLWHFAILFGLSLLLTSLTALLFWKRVRSLAALVFRKNRSAAAGTDNVDASRLT